MFHKHAKSRVTKLTIGVCGTDRNVGCTTLSLALANYLCSKKRLAVACIELNPSHAFLSLSGKDNGKSFRRKGVTLYPETTLKALPDILGKIMRYLSWITDL